MKTVHVLWHKDGDHVAIFETPWWAPAWDRLVDVFLCPCCGISGWLAGKSGRVAGWLYSSWNRALDVTHKRGRELLRVPVESGCRASMALWGDGRLCPTDPCDVHGPGDGVADPAGEG